MFSGAAMTEPSLVSATAAGLIPRSEERGWPDVVYGELIALGYNGCLSNIFDAGSARMGSKFVLRRRPKANGVTPVRQHVLNGSVQASTGNSKAVDPKCHSVSYTMSRSESVVVEYGADDSSDMFQVGRSSESPIDFVIVDAAAVPAAGGVQPATMQSPACLPSGLRGGGHARATNGSAAAEGVSEAPALPLRQHSRVPKPRARSTTAAGDAAADGSSAPLSAAPPLPPRPAERHIYSASAATTEAGDRERQPQPRPVVRGAGDARRPPASHAYALPHRPLSANGRAEAVPTTAVSAPSSSGGAYYSAPAAGPMQQQQQQWRLPPSTISRFACRVVVSRLPPHTARLFAAGFDSNRRIVLGEKATKWCYDGEFDGLTTNGVRLLCPSSFGTDFARPAAELDQQLCGGAASTSRWREVSVCGRVFETQDGSPSSSAATKMLPDADGNVLHDGSLIDLCGVTLMWRSAEGLRRTMQAVELEEYIAGINRQRPQCPVGLNTLILPHCPSAALAAAAAGRAASSDDSSPYIYIRCGHVHGAHGWNASTRPAHHEPQQQQRGPQPAAAAGAVGDSTGSDESWPSHDLRTCPLCLQTGPFVKLQVGAEPSLYVDKGRPTHCFVPCAHMVSERTAKYWSTLALPFLSSSAESFRALCPFCNSLLPSLGEKYVKVIFQEQVY